MLARQCKQHCKYLPYPPADDIRKQDETGSKRKIEAPLDDSITRAVRSRALYGLQWSSTAFGMCLGAHMTGAA